MIQDPERLRADNQAFVFIDAAGSKLTAQRLARGEVTMAKKAKGVRMIVTLECTEQKGAAFQE